MSDDPDRTAPVRAGEELPLDRLTEYLRQNLGGLHGSLRVEQFPQGYSNLTYLVRFEDREFVLRRPPFGNQVATAHDMSREFRILFRLQGVYPPAPRPWLYCDDPRVIGAPFYVMERRRGLIFRKKLPEGLSLSPEQTRRMACSLIDNLAALHTLDFLQAGLSDLGKPQGYVQRQVAGWARRYAEAQTASVPPLEHLRDWLEQNAPPESRAALIHNDYKYDNVMFDTTDLTKIVAVLDWEMATLGDPLLDLGTSLAYWVEAGDPLALRQAAFGPTALPGSLSRKEVVERYEAQTGRRVGNPLFYYVFGLFKLAVIVQQIYARYVRGKTTDRRFAQLDQLVSLLGEQGERALERGTI